MGSGEGEARGDLADPPPHPPTPGPIGQTLSTALLRAALEGGGGGLEGGVRSRYWRLEGGCRQATAAAACRIMPRHAASCCGMPQNAAASQNFHMADFFFHNMSNL